MRVLEPDAEPALLTPLDAVNDAMADLSEGRLQGRGILVPANA